MQRLSRHAGACHPWLRGSHPYRRSCPDEAAPLAGGPSPVRQAKPGVRSHACGPVTARGSLYRLQASKDASSITHAATGKDGDEAPDQEKPCLLLVEDCPDDAELCLHALRRAGIAPDAKWVRDGVEALEWLARGGLQCLRLVLLDLHMPGMNGYELLRRLRREPQTRALPVIVLVSEHDTPELARSFELGADAYLVKPVEAEALRDVARGLGMALGGETPDPARGAQ
jgi:CheY-like chemotaxis protein